MPRQYPTGFRDEMVRRMLAGESVSGLVLESGVPMQTLHRWKPQWKTRIKLANAIFEFIEVFYNRQRRHSRIGYISPVEFEVNLQQ